MAKGHRRLLEATNHGCYFSDCACGWAGGVYNDRAMAAAAHADHVAGREPVGKVAPVLLFGPPAGGQSPASVRVTYCAII